MIVKVFFYIFSAISVALFIATWYLHGYIDSVYLLGALVFYLATMVIDLENRLDKR